MFTSSWQAATSQFTARRIRVAHIHTPSLLHVEQHKTVAAGKELKRPDIAPYMSRMTTTFGMQQTLSSNPYLQDA